MTRRNLLALAVIAGCIGTLAGPAPASEVYSMPKGIELEITPESAPPYFDVTADVKVDGFTLFRHGQRIELTGATFVDESRPYVTPAPISDPTGPPSPAAFAIDQVVSTMTRCGDTVRFVVENKQGKNTFYVVTKTSQSVHINC